MLADGKVVAAGPNGFIVQFRYEQSCIVIEMKSDFKPVVQAHLERLCEYKGALIPVTEVQWKKIREDFYLERKRRKEEEAVSIVTEEPVEAETPSEEEQAFQEKVQQTMNLFGEDIVQIEE